MEDHATIGGAFSGATPADGAERGLDTDATTGILGNLSSASILSGLPAGALADLARTAERRTFAAGDHVFTEGDSGQSLYVVVSGTLEVRRAADDELALDVLGAGDCFGELGWLAGRARTASVVATADAVTIALTSAELDRVLGDNVTYMRALASSVARSLTSAKEEVRHINATLEERVRERTEELRNTQLEVIHRLVRAAELRDDDTGQHIERMGQMSAQLARAVGRSETECELILHAAPMHDIGKLGIPDSVLLKPGKLDAGEWELMKRHAAIGADLLSDSPSEVVQLAAQIALYHHERWDGSGYPSGVSGSQIPLAARICAICDVFDALTSRRPYKEPWTAADAMAEIQRGAGAHFDPKLVDEFLRVAGKLREFER
jgi:HD-GYP domain-containing protein (c-di-GMP phosphodiesterase class II)